MIQIKENTTSKSCCTIQPDFRSKVLKAKRKNSWLHLLLLFLVPVIASAQTKAIDKNKFFTDDRVIEITIESDFNKLIDNKMKADYRKNFQPATITCIFPDSTKVTELVEIRPRGKYRREEFYLPPIMVNFKTPGAARFKKLGKLKLVWPSGNKVYDEQLILKEYLVYKIYNLLTEKSFRVRLVKVTYRDINETIKSRTSYAFFIEEVDNVADRNNCVEVQSIKFHTEKIDRNVTTLVALFQYMIGNTDWAVPIYKNIKLIRSKEDSLSKPFAVPYDFDYCGLVNAEYAIPTPELPITSVRERLYRGFPRTMEELQIVLQNIRSHRQAMNLLIMNFEPLTMGNKKEMTRYLDEFFELTEKEKDVNRIFIKEARVE